MAKSQSGLPDNFDLSVTAADLAGPASLPGYLDDDPVIAFARMQKKEAVPKAHEVKQELPKSSPDVQQVSTLESQVPRSSALSNEAPADMERRGAINPVAARKIAPSIERKRFQINLDVESERMLEEMLTLLSSQSSENSIKISELFQAMLLNIYNSKGEIVLGSLPVRGRWGSATAKAFPVNLAEALREAIVAHETATGGSPFKKVVGNS